MYLNGLSPRLQRTEAKSALQADYVCPATSYFSAETSTLLIPLDKNGIPEVPYFDGLGSTGLQAAVNTAKKSHAKVLGMRSAKSVEHNTLQLPPEIPTVDRRIIQPLPPGYALEENDVVVFEYRYESANVISVAGFDKDDQLDGVRTDSMVISVPLTRERPLLASLKTEALAATFTPISLSIDITTFAIHSPKYLVLGTVYALAGFPNLE